MGGYHVESHADQSAVVGVGKDDEQYDCSEYDDDDDGDDDDDDGDDDDDDDDDMYQLLALPVWNSLSFSAY